MQTNHADYAEGFRHGREEAAAEIERLRSALQAIEHMQSLEPEYLSLIVRQALTLSVATPWRSPDA